MSGSTLDPDNIPQRRRRHTAKGHDVASLGPSDSSDNSDLQDRGCDRVVSAREAGLGKGLDEAEEARLGRTPKTPKR